MILGQTYDEQLFKSEMFRLFINTFADNQNGIINHYKQSCSLSNTQSTITISDGAFLLQGGLIQIQGNETVAVDLDNNCSILAFEIDLTKENTETEFNQGKFKIIKGTTANYPSLQQDDIVNNATGIYQMEFARFVASAGGISNFVDKRVFIDFLTMFENINIKAQTLIDNLNTQADTLIKELEKKIQQAENLPVESDVYTATRNDDVMGTVTYKTIVRKFGKVVNILFSVGVTPTLDKATMNFMTNQLGFPNNLLPEKYRPSENRGFNSTQNTNGEYFGYIYGTVFASGGFSGQFQVASKSARMITTTITYIVD